MKTFAGSYVNNEANPILSQDCYLGKEIDD
ncbi:hypothetical protein KsCSTR_49310 [Candidatus Kuenenia stuttgartiensis]|uniref:Uncharacterized protein n=1 Tax=Kuenenia stuttgartiensis TaxID=174633 RepID=A0A6G7GXI3_KUEST|nr:hypothetical protein KsCSTR_49310 [Candidatus Kuenenia stuttgartiensis]